MASIFLRKDLKTLESYRVVFSKKGIRRFHLCFDDREAACEWAQEHENKYFEDPEQYHNWKLELFLYMQKKGLDVYKHIRRPHIKTK